MPRASGPVGAWPGSLFPNEIISKEVVEEEGEKGVEEEVVGWLLLMFADDNA